MDFNMALMKRFFFFPGAHINKCSVNMCIGEMVFSKLSLTWHRLCVAYCVGHKSLSRSSLVA